MTGLLSRELRLRRPPLSEDLANFATWLGGGYLGSVDEVVVAVALVALVAFLIAGARPAGAQIDDPRTARWQALWLGWAVAALAAGYLFLPDKLYWPTRWS
jgi:hypothetical protein